MRLSLVAALWLAQSVIAQSTLSRPQPPVDKVCFCLEPYKNCTSCVESSSDCSKVCTTKCSDVRNDPQNCGGCGIVVSVPHPFTPRPPSPPFRFARPVQLINVSHCHHQCPSGKCTDGKCVPIPPPCTGGVCGAFQACRSDYCHCFTDATSQGFCGVNAICSDLHDCKSNKDCPTDSRCAVSTCCKGRNVCLKICYENQIPDPRIGKEPSAAK